MEQLGEQVAAIRPTCLTTSVETAIGRGYGVGLWLYHRGTGKTFFNSCIKHLDNGGAIDFVFFHFFLSIF